MPRRGLSMDEIVVAATMLVEEKGIENFRSGNLRPDWR